MRLPSFRPTSPPPTTSKASRSRRPWVVAVVGAAMATGFVPTDAQAIVTHRATSSNSVETGASVGVTKPAGVVADDVLIATAVQNDGGAISPPTGWTSLQSDSPDAASWYRVAGASEPATYTFTHTSGDTFGVVIDAFVGADTAAPIAGSAKSGGTGTSRLLPTTTATRNGSMRWSSAGLSPANNTTATYTGMTKTGERAGNDASVSAAYESQNAGVTTARTVTFSASDPHWTYTAVVNAALPEISAISPSAGPTAGGQSVTITGQYFTGATGVTFGGTAGTAVTVVNDTTITVTTPAKTIGTVEVRVTAPPGTSVDAGTADDYTYTAPPTITALSPSAGPTAGGNSVTITGTNFANLSGAAAVRFGAANASSYTVNSTTSITATAPAGTGTQNVSVTTLGGTNTNTSADDYTYFPPPTVTALSPSAGPTAGGNSVTITGTNFSSLSGAAAVQFGSANATSYTVNSATSITATAPAGTGTQDVRVTTPGGQSSNTASDNYTYYAPPTVTNLSPSTGPGSGGTVVTITGTNFSALSGAAAVQFGGTNAAAYTVNSTTSITATAPAGVGVQDVRVTTPGGTSTNVVADDYTYVPLPTVTNLSPDAGPLVGGTIVTITGTGFTGANQVRFGATNASSYTVNSATSITATAPAGTGTQNVTVTTLGGTSANTSSDDYTYHAIPTITAISPQVGPVAGGTIVTITGTNFTGMSGAAAVRFGATNAASYTVNSATSITTTAPAGTGTQDVRVVTPGGTTADTPADDFTYYPLPTITSIAPNEGPVAGGTVITITGTNFTGLSGAAAVRFGATNATAYTVNSATSITATAPAGTGTQDVRVVTPGGITADTPADNFTYYAVPTITAVSPSDGPVAGGTIVTITGTNFSGLTGASAVRFGATNATAYTVNSATSITATAPAGTGTQDVRVVTPGGTTADTPADNYTYHAVPTITAISPGGGLPAGGTVVTITGTNFTGLSGASAVRFGATNATTYTVNSATSITATAPAGTGTQDVRVVTPGGTTANTGADDYVYVAAPSIIAISPSVGPVAGGTAVTITGTNFTGVSGAAAVRFGATNATTYTVNSATSITATAPAGTGTQDVRVTAYGGITPDTLADDFTYYAVPSITAISPSAGPLAGGTIVTITGTNFSGLSGAAGVRFGATNATSYTVNSATSITATAPAGTGTQDIRVTTPGGITADTPADNYTYTAAPTVSAITPSDGPTGGGTTVTITGTNFTGATTVRFGATDASGFTIVNSTTITATAPPGTGMQDVRVTTPGGQSANSSADDFTYHAAPTITTISPMSGPAPGGTVVTITGTNFTGMSGAAAVRFGATNATSYTVNSASSITATAPAGSGTVDVRVSTPGGITPDTATDDFTYVPAPVVSLISPTSGPVAGGTLVTITGTTFTGATQVRFGATNATGFTVVNGTTITATAPAHAAGITDVRVTTPSGTSADTAADDFTYIPLPTVTALSPSSGPTTGGTTVTISGTGFTGTTAVRFGATNATGYSVVNATTITATAPAGTGTQDLRVTAPGGQSANTSADDYAYVNPPVVSALAPTAGPLAGGTVVTITGSFLTGATNVTFGGIAATSFSEISANEITATAPAGTGTVDVRVTTPDGVSANTAADDFTYRAAPAITAISPNQGPEVGGSLITITGTGFTGASAVKFGLIDALGYTVVNATTITANAPPHATGTVDVRVTAPGGTSSNTAADDFSYLSTCSAGSLLATATDFSFTPFTLDGRDQVSTTSTKVGVSDMTGAGAGWKLEVGSERFTAGPGGDEILAANAARITDATATPHGGNCSVPTRALNAYPVTLPISPAKEKVYAASIGTGLGPVDVNLEVALDVPGNVKAGTYRSTWTIDLTAAP